MSDACTYCGLPLYVNKNPRGTVKAPVHRHSGAISCGGDVIVTPWHPQATKKDKTLYWMNKSEQKYRPPLTDAVGE